MAANKSKERPRASHQSVVTNGAVMVIKQLLNSPHAHGWYEGSIKHLYAGATLNEDLSQFAEPEVKDPKNPTETESKDFYSWASNECVLELTESQREAMKVLVKYAIQKGLLRPNKITMGLIEILGLME